MLQPVSSFAMDALLCRVDKTRMPPAVDSLGIGSGRGISAFVPDAFGHPGNPVGFSNILGCPSAFLPPPPPPPSALRPSPWSQLPPVVSMDTSAVGPYPGGTGGGFWPAGIAAWLQMRQQVAFLLQQQQSQQQQRGLKEFQLGGQQKKTLPPLTLPSLNQMDTKVGLLLDNRSTDASWPLDHAHIPQLHSKLPEYSLSFPDIKVTTDCLSGHLNQQEHSDSHYLGPPSTAITDLTISSPGSTSKHHRSAPPEHQSRTGSLADDTASSHSPNGSPSKKRQRSGFQDGVTVGYTYDAFFVSDGRSKRRSIHSAEPSIEVKESPVKTAPLTTMSSNPLSSPSSVLTGTSGGDGRQRYTCNECGKDYATSSNLSRHKQTHRSLDSKLAKKCPHCDKVYVSMPALSMHVLTHDLKHRCSVCGKAFSRPWLLQGHLRAHTGEKPYGCAHCGRAFADRSNLRAHMQTHSMMKQFECGKCGKSFALKSYLNKHIEAACMTPSPCDESPALSPNFSFSSCGKQLSGYQE